MMNADGYRPGTTVAKLYHGEPSVRGQLDIGGVLAGLACERVKRTPAARPSRGAASSPERSTPNC